MAPGASRFALQNCTSERTAHARVARRRLPITCRPVPSCTLETAGPNRQHRRGQSVLKTYLVLADPLRTAVIVFPSSRPHTVARRAAPRPRPRRNPIRSLALIYSRATRPRGWKNSRK